MFRIAILFSNNVNYSVACLDMFRLITRLSMLPTAQLIKESVAHRGRSTAWDRRGRQRQLASMYRFERQTAFLLAAGCRSDFLYRHRDRDCAGLRSITS